MWRVDPGLCPWTMPSTVPSRSDTALVTSTSYLADTVQTVTVGPGAVSGTFELSFNGQTTTTIAAGAVASLVQSDLEALSSIGTGNVSVTGPAGGPFVVRFIGTLAGANQPLMTASSQDSNGNPQAISVVTTTPGGDAGLPQKVADPRGGAQGVNAPHCTELFV